MTLAQIMTLALRQLDEDPADISEYDDLFRMYANEGYQIVMRDIYKPRDHFDFETGKDGSAEIKDRGIVRIVELKDGWGRDIWYDLSVDGTTIYTREREKTLHAVAEVEVEPIYKGTDEPQFPEFAHNCLVDYVCYRHLCNGNMGKQQRAQFFLQKFWENARRIRPQGMGSVTHFKNLYAVTDARYTR